MDALITLLRSDAAAEELVTNGGVSILVGRLDPDRRDDDPHKFNARLLLCLVAATHPSNRAWKRAAQEVLDSGCAALFTKFLTRSHHRQIQMFTGRLVVFLYIANQTACATMVKTLGDGGCIPTMVTRLREADSTAQKHYWSASAAMLGIFVRNGYAEAVLAADAAPQLTKVITQAATDSLATWSALDAIEQLIIADAGQRVNHAIFIDGGIRIALEPLRQSSNEKIRTLAAKLLLEFQ
jgi:hypothetical protein